MVLTKDELISALQTEVRLLLHLASKVEPEKLDYRPSAKQRSTLELLQYLTMMGPVQMGLAKAGVFDWQDFGANWTAQEAASKKLNLEEIREAIAKQSTLYAEILNSCSDEDLRTEIELFGVKATRGSMMVSLVLIHYAAYRMQLFLYLKASGQEELNTMNLWVGIDKA